MAQLSELQIQILKIVRGLQLYGRQEHIDGTTIFGVKVHYDTVLLPLVLAELFLQSKQPPVASMLYEPGLQFNMPSEFEDQVNIAVRAMGLPPDGELRCKLRSFMTQEYWGQSAEDASVHSVTYVTRGGLVNISVDRPSASECRLRVRAAGSDRKHQFTTSNAKGVVMGVSLTNVGLATWADVSDAPAGPNCEHSKDFTFVRWFGTTYRFNKRQATIVGLLWVEWKKGGLGLGEETIGVILDSEANRFRMKHAFTKKGTPHAAWKTMIQSPNRGIYALHEPTAGGITKE